MASYAVPDSLPVLSRGKHRSPRKGACFMEMASVLAGEPWSDHPKCTHPLIGHLARLVNDHTSDDEARGRLAVMIPSVVGIRGGGTAWTVDLTATVAVEVIADVPEPSQRALAAGLLRCEELTAELGPGLVAGTDTVRQALDDVPGAVAWARQFLSGSSIDPRQFSKRSAPSVMRCAVRGVTASSVSNPDARLRELLRAAIRTARWYEPEAVAPQRPAVPLHPRLERQPER